jgi:hypothetical protein
LKKPPVSHLVGSVAPTVLLAILLVAPPAASQEGPTRLANVSVSASGAEWIPLESESGSVLTVQSPAGEVERISAAPGGSVRFSSFAADGSRRPDGVYVWEFRPVRKAAKAGTAGPEDGVGRTQRTVPVAGDKLDAQSGAFSILGGLFVAEGAEEAGSEGAAVKATAPGTEAYKARAGEGVLDQVFADDLIVQGSACVGLDCVNNENFGFDTIRLKENNLRIKFEDTSAGTFPSTDWQLTANDSASGGANKFSIEDITGAKNPFTITAGAATNSMFVSSTGRVGLRTATPVLDLHVNTSNSPGIRLEQNSSGGFTSQTWDIAGNEANFFIRDVTSGSRLPFRIRPGAPTSSIDISASGDVGVGTASPSAPLHVLRSSASDVTVLRVENALGRARMDFGAANGELWFFQNDSAPDQERFNISLNGSGGVEVQISQRLDGDGLPTMKVDGSVQATNVIFSSSREVKTAIAPLDASSVLESVASLPIAEWRYKTESDSSRHVGPMAEDFAGAFGLGGDGKTISMVDANGIALASIQALYTKLREKDGDIDELRKANEELMARLAAIERSLGSVAK